jgi:hypothetical protein
MAHKNSQENIATAFKRFYVAEYHNLKEQQKVNNFHLANATHNIMDPLEHLAFAASTTDHDIVTQLTTIIQEL